jgi:hypothetical protein
MKCGFDFFYNFCMKHSSLEGEFSEMDKHVYWTSCEVMVIIV